MELQDKLDEKQQDVSLNNQAPLKIRAAMNKERLKTSLAKNSTASASRIKNATKGD
jgi:hypothetical protein